MHFDRKVITLQTLNQLPFHAFLPFVHINIFRLHFYSTRKSSKIIFPFRHICKNFKTRYGLSYYSKLSCNLVTNIIWCQLQCKIGTIASLPMDLTRQHSIPRGVFFETEFPVPSTNPISRADAERARIETPCVCYS